MFEHFARDARLAVVHAQDSARELGHRWIGMEHMLLAIVGIEDPTGAAFRDLDVTPERVRAQLIRMIGPGQAGSTDRFARVDSAALAAIGIDLNAVREKVTATLGPDALRRVPEHRRRGPIRLLRRRVRRAKPITGHLPLTRRVKECLELAVREARQRGSAEIGTEHLALAMLGMSSGMAGQILGALGVSVERLRTALRDRYREAG